MYEDAIFRWNIFKGCEFDCIYCKSSFQRQAKRQKHRCLKCYEYTPHFHPERLNQSLPNTIGGQFIWVASSGDISFCKKEWMDLILNRIRELPQKTFFFQTKNPIFFKDYHFPDNVILGITLEADRYPNESYSKAPKPKERMRIFDEIDHERKTITIEPVLNFDLFKFTEMIVEMRYQPERIYIGYDSKKNELHEPSLEETSELIALLKLRLGEECKIKEKLMRRAWWENE